MCLNLNIIETFTADKTTAEFAWDKRGDTLSHIL